jgi:hypothetical protein
MASTAITDMVIKKKNMVIKKKSIGESKPGRLTP